MLFSCFFLLFFLFFLASSCFFLFFSCFSSCFLHVLIGGRVSEPDKDYPSELICMSSCLSNAVEISSARENREIQGTEGTEMERFKTQRHKDTEKHRVFISWRGREGEREQIFLWGIEIESSKPRGECRKKRKPSPCIKRNLACQLRKKREIIAHEDVAVLDELRPYQSRTP